MPPLPSNILSSLMSSIHIDSTAATAANSAAPTINVGDIIKLVVRQNQGNGQGLLYSSGQLIPAQLPEFLLAGDRLTAKVLLDGEQLIFKILELNRGTHAETTAGYKNVELQVKNFVLQTLNPFLEKGADNALNFKNLLSAENIPPELKQFIATELAPLLTTLNENVSSSQVLEKFLAFSNNPSTNQSLKSVAQELKKLLLDYTPSVTQRTIDTMRGDIIKLLEQNIPEEQLTKSLTHLVESAKKELNGQSPTKTTDITTRARLFEAFAAVDQSSSAQTHPAQQLLSILNSLAGQNKAIDPKVLTDLTQLATRLENLAVAQETLAQLNPVMQALGDPALILFPFIFHGIFNYAQVSLPPDEQVKKKNQQEDSNEGSKNGDKYNRVQISVPLPHLGIVDIDLAHKEDEILLRFTVADQEIADFILEQSEKFVLVLKEKGYQQAELVTQIRPETPKTTVGLNISTKTSFVA